MAVKVDTRRILAESLENLLEKRELKDITVNEIVGNCGAARSTFYHHFKDKYDLANWIYEDFLTGYLNTQEHVDMDYYSMQLEPLEFIYSKKTFFSKICKYKGQNCFYEFVFQITQKRAVEMARRIQKTDNLPEEILIAIDYMSSGHAYLLNKWVVQGFFIKPDKMAQYLLENTAPGIERICRVEEL